MDKLHYQRLLPILCAGLIGILLALASFGRPAFSALTDQELEERYTQARQAISALEKSPQKKLRQRWQPLIDQFQEIYKQSPQTPWGERAMFMVGRIYYRLHQWSGLESDLDLSLDHLTRFVNHYPQSPLADDALFLSAEITFQQKKNPEKARQLLQSLMTTYPQGDMRKKAEELLAQVDKGTSLKETPQSLPLENPYSEEPRKETAEPEAGPKYPQITGLRHWSTPQYTRVAVDVAEKISFRHRLLKKDPAIEKPERLYLDLYPARLVKGQISPLTIEDGLLRGARIGQYDASTVRLVLDIESIKGYKIFFLENPFRLIVDVTGKEKAAAARPPELPSKDQKLSLAQQLGLGVRRVVIDPGHGGKDKGAIGHNGTLYEKDLVLKIAKRLSQRLHQELKLQTFLTRDTDRFIPLEERTAIANTKNADLFVSIHVNASPNPLAEGIETYFLNLASDEESIRVAARENATSNKRIGELQKILKDLMLNTKIDESSRLANHVQQNLILCLNEKFGPVKNLGVKQAPFYVLIGAQMPSVLVEASFISNPKESERLMQDDYIEQVVDGIMKGLDSYIRESKLAGIKEDPGSRKPPFLSKK